MTEKPEPPADHGYLPVDGILEAPIIFFEICPTLGNNGGLINVLLATSLIAPSPNGQISTRIKAVAHLRMTAGSAKNLRDTLDKALLIGAPVENPQGKAN
ncbi:MAG: hypothetical protein NVV83_12475 [Afipia sp.]|jgi:hypothetical protein|nr:hypothetical protein [Afipia sp.]